MIGSVTPALCGVSLMARFIGVGPQDKKGRQRTLDVYCEDCESLWVAAKFPISVEKLRRITKLPCMVCGGTNISVLERSLEDPNGPKIRGN